MTREAVQPYEAGTAASGRDSSLPCSRQPARPQCQTAHLIAGCVQAALSRALRLHEQPSLPVEAADQLQSPRPLEVLPRSRRC